MTTPFERLQEQVHREDYKHIDIEAVDLLVAYHEEVQGMKMHMLSDQYMMRKYKLEKIQSKLFGMNFDYSALHIQPDEYIPKLRRLIRRYKKKKGFKLTFFWYHKMGHDPDAGYPKFPEIISFFKWWDAKKAKIKKRKKHRQR